MPLFGTIHLTLLASIAVTAALLAILCRTGRIPTRPTRLILGYTLGLNELIWWAFRYSHEGFNFPNNLPLQLCDVLIWATVAACITLSPALVEFTWFAGLAGAGMALLTPDLWAPWPQYPAIYFFLAHGGIVAGAMLLVAGRLSPLRPHALWRAFSMLIAFASFVGAVNQMAGTNYMYLCRKPGSASLLDQLGPWPIYLIGGAAVTLAIFGLLWLPVRPAKPTPP
ncbi:MAG: TIGR02206 family membrane protein [Bryobacteraceae bacterium]|nr:TIGR02206 family membrane protein [Bryobacteraceae bacterium]